MFLNSIRWRLQMWYGLILLLILAGFGVTAYQLVRTRTMKSLDDELHQRVALLLTEFVQNTHAGFPGGPGNRPPPMEDDFPGGQPPQRLDDHGHPDNRHFKLSPKAAMLFDQSGNGGFYYAVWLRDGTVFAKSSNSPPTLLRPNTTKSRIGSWSAGSVRESFEVTPPGECVLVGKSMAPELAGLRQFALSLAGIGFVVLLLGLAGGWWLASRAIHPIEDISAAAAKISAGDLSQRINVEDTETEFGRLTGVLNSTFARLEAAFAQQGRFTADAAHELRTPLSVILLQVQTALKNERTPADYKKTLEACQRSAQRMKTLIESLLELARLDAGQEPMAQKSFDLSNVMNECVELVEPLASEKGILIQRELASASVLGDSARLSQVFTNLLNNAIQYSAEKGTLRLTCGKQNGGVVATVEDSGVGISGEDLPKVFERFFRADASRSNSDGHSGLGLAICKSIVNAHGGTIDVSSEKGRGTQFRIHLPADATVQSATDSKR